MPLVEVCREDELPEGALRLVEHGSLSVGVYNLGDRLCAIEDRCSHDDGPLCEGDFEPEDGVVVCPRHGARFDICSGRPLTLPAYRPVATFPVTVADGLVHVELP